MSRLRFLVAILSACIFSFGIAADKQVDPQFVYHLKNQTGQKIVLKLIGAKNINAKNVAPSNRVSNNSTVNIDVRANQQAGLPHKVFFRVYVNKRDTGATLIVASDAIKYDKNNSKCVQSVENKEICLGYKIHAYLQPAKGYKLNNDCEVKVYENGLSKNPELTCTISR